MAVPERQNQKQWILDALATHEGALLRYALRLTNNNLEQARDVVQDTFLRLCKQPREKVEQRLAAWLFTVCRNRVFEIYRKEERMRPLSETRLATEATAAPDPASQHQKRDQIQTVLGLVDTLPDNQREVVRLKFQNELSYREISEVTGLTVTNVGFLLHTAIRKLRGELRHLEA